MGEFWTFLCFCGLPFSFHSSVPPFHSFDKHELGPLLGPGHTEVDRKQNPAHLFLASQATSPQRETQRAWGLPMCRTGNQGFEKFQSRLRTQLVIAVGREYLPPGTVPLGQAVCFLPARVGLLCSQGQVGMAPQGQYGGRGLTADGDAQLHTTPLRQLHVERTTARDDRLWVQRDRDPCETQLHIRSGLAGRDPTKSLP